MQMLLKDIIETYQGKSLLIICFLLAIIYIVCTEKSETLKRQLVPAALLIVFAFNNIALAIWKELIGRDAFFDIIYSVPVIISVAYALCSVFYRIDKLKYRALFIVLSILTLCVAYFSVGYFNNDDGGDREQVSIADVEVVADYFKGSFSGADDRPVALCTIYCYDEMRTFAPFIPMAIGNEEYEADDLENDSDEYILKKLVGYGIWDNLQKVQAVLDNMKVRYIVIPSVMQSDDSFAKLGFFKIIDTDTISLYEKQNYDINHGLDGYIRRLYYYLLKRQCTEDELRELEAVFEPERENYADIAMTVIDSQEFKRFNYSFDEYLYILFEAIENRTPNDGDMLFMKEYLGDIRDKRFIVEQFTNGDKFKESLK